MSEEKFVDRIAIHHANYKWSCSEKRPRRNSTPNVTFIFRIV